MNFDHVLFDFDNTLLCIEDSREFFDRVLTETLTAHDYRGFPNKEARKTFWLAGDKYLRLLDEWKLKNKDNFWSTFDRIDLKLRQKLIKTGRIHLFRDVKPTLEKLHLNYGTIKLGIVSNSGVNILNYFLKKYEIDSYFQEIFGIASDLDQPKAKPSPKGIEIVLRKMNFKPEISRALMIGDSGLDVTAAKNAGIPSCLIKRDSNERSLKLIKMNNGPEFVIEGLNDIFTLLE